MKYNFSGLSSQEVEDSRSRHGSNELTPVEIEGFWKKLIQSFKDPIIVILLVALMITFILAILGFAAWYASVGVAAAVGVAASIATLSEYKSETSFQKLQEEAARIKANVFRNGHITETFISDIVLGDYVLVQPGDKVPADGKIITGTLKVNQASLTGEADDVKKAPAPDGYNPEQKDNLMDPYLIFRGSVVGSGEAVIKVDTVGDKTLYGQLAQELSSEERQSPLQVKLSSLAASISKFGYIGSIFITLAFLFKRIVIDNHFVPNEIIAHVLQWEILLLDIVSALTLAIIIIVVAVPEGLPMMIAIVLSLNMRRLLHAKVLVRKLVGIETAGSLNILFCDKTGTITEGQMGVSLFMSGNPETYTTLESIPERLRNILIGSLKNNTSCILDVSATGKEKIFGGNRVDRAFMEFIAATLSESSAEVIHETIPFDSNRKFSAVYVTMGNKKFTLAKGAPEIILQHCDYYYDAEGNKTKLESKATLLKKIDELSDRNMRVVAVAISEGTAIDDYSSPRSRVLVGIIGLRDEIRKESLSAIEQARKAGIQVVMITGDKKETAVAIAREVGLLQDSRDVVLTTLELNQYSDNELKELLPHLRVVARALPTDKSRLVKIAQELNRVVGMTGDGINDAAALNRADVGFAMGSGTEVAKEAGDIVILDDNFSSITKAILYGRTIFYSIRKFIVFQLTVNVAAISIAFLGPFFGRDFPLTLIQLLWINLIMDTMAGMAYGGAPALVRYMMEKPIPRDENIISKDMRSSILFSSGVIIALSLIFLEYEPIQALFYSEATFMTGFFAFFVFINNFNKLNVRTTKLNLFDHMWEHTSFLKVVALIFAVQIFFTYFGGEILRTVGLSFNEWVFVISLSMIIIPIDLTRKLLRDVLERRVVICDASASGILKG
ncbi:MAG: Calcium-transporting ATPase [Dehalococcoidia bacterium]|nr:Calcium-transporting ATPase [Bacillota bacterium]MBT9142536.1 Calcium-transporting ATPase [Bacillota bacterium]